MRKLMPVVMLTLGFVALVPNLKAQSPNFTKDCQKAKGTVAELTSPGKPPIPLCRNSHGTVLFEGPGETPAGTPGTAEIVLQECRSLESGKICPAKVLKVTPKSVSYTTGGTASCFPVYGIPSSRTSPAPQIGTNCVENGPYSGQETGYIIQVSIPDGRQIELGCNFKRRVIGCRAPNEGDEVLITFPKNGLNVEVQWTAKEIKSLDEIQATAVQWEYNIHNIKQGETKGN